MVDLPRRFRGKKTLLFKVDFLYWRMAKAIEVRRLSFSYPEEKNAVLKDISFDVEQGEILGIIGPSGCGKSTLMFALSGLIPHSVKGKLKGKVFISGKEVKELTMIDLSQTSQILFQNPESQLFALNVEDEITFGLENLNFPWEEIEKSLDQELQELNIENIRKNSIEELSSGQKQRVALASILAMKPSILLFDEPTANLDPLAVRKLEETIKKLSKKHTIIVVEHNIEFVQAVCDRALLMDKGSILVGGKLNKVLGSSMYRKVMVSPKKTQAVMSKLKRLRKDVNKKPVLEIKNLGFSYPNKARVLSDISLNVGEGDFLGIIGMNGSGKSTLALNIIGLLKGSGRISLKDKDISGIDVFSRTKDIGYVFQNPNYQLFEDDLDREIGFGPLNIGLSENEVKERVDEALDTIGLTGLRKHDPHALSVGQKRRVSIASVLAMKPKVLIIDEPDTGLDHKTARGVMDHIKKLNKNGMTIIMISHNLALVSEYCDRVIGVKDGKIVKPGVVYKQYFTK